MPKILYKSLNFRNTSLSVIMQANKILEDFAARGYDLTLRQLYYQFVSQALIPNKQSEYKKLGSIVNDGRLAGLIDWDHITDRTRNLQRNSHWNSPSDGIYSLARQYQIDKWKEQETRVEVWIEKDALVGVISSICNRLDVPYFSCRGYTSQSEMWSAAQRMDRYYGQHVIVLHMGDHDPSGIDMTRDIQERLNMFADKDIEIIRIALNMDQIRQYNPPPNPAKITDTRSDKYIDVYGNKSWELDALDPDVLVDLVESCVIKICNDKKWKAAINKEKKEIRELKKVSDNWAGVVKGLKK